MNKQALVFICASASGMLSLSTASAQPVAPRFVGSAEFDKSGQLLGSSSLTDKPVVYDEATGEYTISLKVFGSALMCRTGAGSPKAIMVRSYGAEKLVVLVGDLPTSYVSTGASARTAASTPQQPFRVDCYVS